MEKKEKVIILNERQQNELDDQIHNNKDKRKLNWFYGVKKCIKIAIEDKWYLQGTRQRKNSNGTTMETLHVGDYDVH